MDSSTSSGLRPDHWVKTVIVGRKLNGDLIQRDDTKNQNQNNKNGNFDRIIDGKTNKVHDFCAERGNWRVTFKIISQKKQRVKRVEQISSKVEIFRFKQKAPANIGEPFLRIWEL